MMLWMVYRGHRAAAWTVLGAAAGCGGKAAEPVVISTSAVAPESLGTADADTGGRDTGLPGTGADGEVEGDFWYVATVSGGSSASASQAFDGDEVQIESGSARLVQGAAEFLIELRYSGALGTVPYQADCWIPIEVTGGLPATAADDSGAAGPVGCASVEVGTTTYAVEPDGLTVVEINDGRVVSGEFSLHAQAPSGAILQANGRIHAVLCDRFWSGVPCTY